MPHTAEFAVAAAAVSVGSLDMQGMHALHPKVPLSVTEIPGSETGTILGKLFITSWASSAVDLTLSYFALSNSPQELLAFPLEVA